MGERFVASQLTGGCLESVADSEIHCGKSFFFACCQQPCEADLHISAPRKEITVDTEFDRLFWRIVVDHQIHGKGLHWQYALMHRLVSITDGNKQISIGLRRPAH